MIPSHRLANSILPTVIGVRNRRSVVRSHPGVGLENRRGQILPLDPIALRTEVSEFNSISQFTDISGPAVAKEAVEGAGGDPIHVAPVNAMHIVQESIDQDRNVLEPFP